MKLQIEAECPQWSLFQAVTENQLFHHRFVRSCEFTWWSFFCKGDMSFAFPNENSGVFKDLYTLGDKLGSYVNNYLSYTYICSGAFSVVMKGVCKDTKETYAIKIVDKEETNAKDMFRELSIMSRFNHPNIVLY
jgi:hypothetical protein